MNETKTEIPKEIVRGSLKLIILQTLNEADHYGYSLAQSIRERSDNLLKAGEGSLYPSLHNLEEKGLVESYWDENFTPKRKYYHITQAGKEYLNEEKDGWNKLIDILNKYLH